MAEINGSEDTVYVALGKNSEEGKLTLVWALQNLELRKVCILHVHQPAEAIFSHIGGASAASELEENDLRAIQEIEKKIIQKNLEKYLDICFIAGVDAEVIRIDQDDVGEGIVKLIYQHSVKKLVMGAAADKHYSPGMTDVKSKTAIYVRQHAPASCLFWFICGGHLIHTGGGDVDQDDAEHEQEHASNALFLYREEMERRKEAEEALAKEKEEHTKTKQQRDDLQVERDNAFRLTEELLGKQAEEASGSTHMSSPRFYHEFSVAEIQEATDQFDPSLKISEGDYGSIYKGLLHHTPVAIKLLHQNTREGPSEFQQKVEILSKYRHPNLVTFMGACPELWALIFEYLPNGSLADRLSCKDGSPPLQWKTRIQIATELCSFLIFISSMNPHGIIPHGHLNLGDILLDENLVCKVNNFGIRHNIGEVSTNSAVRSFGIILSQLLTGECSEDIVGEMKDAIEEGNLEDLLDSSAGEWPFMQATQLAHLALRCYESSSIAPPDLASEFMGVLGPMRASCGVSTSTSSFRLGNIERCQPPSYFICPILQEVMKDPHVAADGFTYEAEALTSWLESGHDTSPMTNVRLEHKTLIPNFSLRSAIQEWQQQA